MTCVLLLWYNVVMKLKTLRKKRKLHTHGLTRWEYKNYLRGKHWKTFRKRMKREKKYECYICGTKHKLQLHHRSYSKLGEESKNQMLWVCQFHHSLIHKTLWENKDDTTITLWNIAGKIKKQYKEGLIK